MEIKFKPIEHSDIDTLIKMMQEFYSIDNYSIDIETSKMLFREFIDNKNLGKGWLIMENDVSLGYLIFTFCFSFEYKGRFAFLDELYILEAARGKGLGKKALLFAKEEFSKLSINTVYLEVEDHNEAAKKLYLSNDFVMHTRSFMRYTIN